MSGKEDVGPEWLIESLDRLYAENLAMRIIAMRMWGYLAIASKADAQFVANQKRMSLESVRAYEISGHADPEKIKRIAGELISDAFDGIIHGKPSSVPLQ